MIKISRLADYATIILNRFCCEEDKLFSAATLAEETHITLPTVSKILKILCEANLLDSTRGVNGGYRLARSPKKITIAEVITVIDGKPAITQCSQKTGLCDHNQYCQLRGNWQFINKMIYELLEKFTIMDMHHPLAK